MLEHVLSGEVALPAGNRPEPFVDADASPTSQSPR